MIQKENDLRELLELSQEWAREAGDVTLQHFGGMLRSDTKADGTPVTAADRAAESLLRERIHRHFPHHGILGEEFGETLPGAPVRWILDPIDGTRSFMRGVPLYGVLVGIEMEGRPVLGVMHFPGLGETVAAALGEGCWWNGNPARVSSVSDLRGSAILTTDPLEIRRSPMARGWEALIETAGLARTWGDCYGHMLVATGRADVMVDPVLSPWDAAPMVPILTEAGGAFTDAEGTPGAYGGSGISTNGLLHTQVLKMLRGDP